MGKRVKIPEAATIVGLSEYAIRKGIKEGRYPYIRTGIGSGKIYIDLSLLDEALKQEALNNASYQSEARETIYYGHLRKIKE